MQKIQRKARSLLHRNIVFILCFFLFSSSAYAALSTAISIDSSSSASVFPGQTTRLVITLTNDNDASAINNVSLNSSLPPGFPDGLRIAGQPVYECTDPATGTTSVGTGTLTASLHTQAINLNGGVIPAKANNTDGLCRIVIPVEAGSTTGSTANYTYQIASGAVTGNDGAPVSNIGAVNQSISVLALAKPEISKAFSAAAIDLGGAATQLTVTVSNSNDIDLESFNITDNFPQLGGVGIIKVASPANASASCTSGSSPTFTPLVNATSISAAGTIPKKGSCTFMVDVIANSTNGEFETGAQTNQINRDSDFTTAIGLGAKEHASAKINVRSPLQLSKQFAHQQVSSGEADVFTVTLRNASSAPLSINRFTDNPIDGVNGTAFGLVAKLAGSSNTCGGTLSLENSGDGIALTGGTIPANGNCTVTVAFDATAETTQVPRTYTNAIPKGAVSINGQPGIISQPVSASVLVVDELRVLKSASPTSAAPGNPINYRVTVQNFSTNAINNVNISDGLPAGLTYLTGVIKGVNFNPVLSGTGCTGLTESGVLGGNAAAFVVGNLPARTDAFTPGSCTVSFWAMVDPNASNNVSTVNTINAGDVCYGTPPVCNGSSVSSPASNVNTEVFKAVKHFNNLTSVSLAEGTIAKLSIRLENLSARPLTDVSVSDSFPSDGTGQLRIATPANASTSCGGTLTAVPGANSLALNNAVVPARANGGTGDVGSCVINVDVIGPAGIYNNIANTAATQTQADGNTKTINGISSNTATLNYQSSLSAEKLFNPSLVASGGRSKVTIRLKNNGSTILEQVTVTDPLPNGMVLADPVNVSTSCAGQPVLTGISPGASTLTVSGLDIAGNSSCDLLFDVIANGASNWVNTIPVGGITANGGVRNVKAVSATLNYDPPTDISVTKTTQPSVLTFPGETSQLTIQFINGNTAVNNLAVTDYFTADGRKNSALNGMVIAATTGISTDCPGAIVDASPGGRSIGLKGVSLGANQRCSLKVNVTSTAIGGVTNFIPSGAIQTAQGLTNSGQASTSLAAQNNVGVQKKFTPNIVKPGERSRLRITFKNPTNQPLANLSVTDTMPAGVTIPSGANPTSTCRGAVISVPANNQVAISGATLPASTGLVPESCYSEIDVLAANQGELENIIPVGAVTGTGGGNPVTNTRPASDKLFALLPLEIHKAFDNKTQDAGNPRGFTTGFATQLPGASSVLTVRIDNPNSSDITGVALTDVLPANLVIAQTPNASTTCSNGFVTAAASTNSVRLSGATVAANSFCTVSVNVLSNLPGTYNNDIPAAAVSSNQNVSNEESTRATLIISRPPSIEKQFQPAVIAAGTVSKLTLFFNNDNASAITLTEAFTDELPTAPGSVTVANPANVSSNCPGAVTATSGTGRVTYANGAQIPSGGCSVTVDVTGSVTGSHINNIPAGSLKTSVGSNQRPANSTLLISPLGYIAGRVFLDNNVQPDGLFQANVDTALSGVLIQLHRSTSCDDSSPITARTDSLGNYLFAELPSGTYSVCQPGQPSNTRNGTTTAGILRLVNGSSGRVGTASNPSGTRSQITAIQLNNDGASGEVSGSTGNNFAEVAPSTISGHVFTDLNNNGQKNGSDSGIADVPLELLNQSGVVVATVTTNAQGFYQFEEVLPGTYSIREPQQPTNTSNGITSAGPVSNGGTTGTASAVSVLPSQISNIILPPNTRAEQNNFAELPQGRRISGRIFLDFNNDASLNGNDHGITGQTINLVGTDINNNAVNRSATTNSQGEFVFDRLPEGRYTLTQPSQPVDTANGTTIPGSAGGSASAVSVTPSTISNINLNGTTTVSGDNLFAEVPTAIVDLKIDKSHTPTALGNGSSSGFYTLTPSNIGNRDSRGTITVTDTLPAGMTAHRWPTTGVWICTVSGSIVTCRSDQVISAGSQGTPIILGVTVASGLKGQVLINQADINGGGEAPAFAGNNRVEDPTAIAESATVAGHVWRDSDHDRQMDLGEPAVPNWLVQLELGDQIVATTTTDAKGAYRFEGISPGTGYRIRFREPNNGAIIGQPVPNENGAEYKNGIVNSDNNPAGASSGDGSLRGLTLVAGSNIVAQSLPLDPSGIIYDAVSRQPVSGVTIQILNAGSVVENRCLVGSNATQTTGVAGFYQFLLINPAPAGCPGDGQYRLAISSYPSGFQPQPSVLIPVTPGPYTPVADVAPNLDAIQQQNTAPPVGSDTVHYFDFLLTLAGVGVVNNHIPIDPVIDDAVRVSKTTPKRDVVRGELVPYTLTFTNTQNFSLSNLALVDVIPAGFQYVANSAKVAGQVREPVINGRELTWDNVSLAAANAGGSAHQITIDLILVVGSGVGEGNYTNQAFVNDTRVSSRISNVASATVTVVPDPLFDCSDLIGKVFDDRNINGYQDNSEPGLAGIRVVTPRGLLITTDQHGRFHIACADIPDRFHGSSFILKLDTRTLPSGYRLTTENPRVIRLSQGKLAKLNFGAALHRIVRVDIDQNSFDDTPLALTAKAEQQLQQLIDILKQAPSVLRLNYHSRSPESPAEQTRRIQLFSQALQSQWQNCDCGLYDLNIEPMTIISSLPEGHSVGEQMP